MRDRLMLRVPDATAAIRLGARPVARNLGHRALGVRVGMHSGPAVQREADCFGTTINVAARVASLAKAGEILVTAATREAAEPELCRTLLEPRGVEHCVCSHACADAFDRDRQRYTP